ncbi:major facilitator superfamily domain-containing protein [Leptodontidium sp. 2 PMI_412]|nr:major facilitator superfamily domain-containing protein [Leptodontidium sp. MPI-SDFR-AT-0119]KAH9217073.1 major facilitator superfamily domain-containing protein [Leptodontidium sp. 2 PMI_412]
MAVDLKDTSIEHQERANMDEKPRCDMKTDEESMQSLVRKLDMTLMPVIWVLYLFNYLDRNTIAYALMQISSNMILTRVRPSLYMPFWVLIWSCISAATAGTHNFAGLIAVQFFPRVAEAPFFPRAVYLLSCWYTKKELALRTAIPHSGLVLATANSGLLATGIFAGLDQARGLSGWGWLFIIEGAGSFAAGAVAIFLLPDFPASTTGSTTLTAS